MPQYDKNALPCCRVNNAIKSANALNTKHVYEAKRDCHAYANISGARAAGMGHHAGEAKCECAHSARALSSLKVPFTFFFFSHLFLCFQQLNFVRIVY